MAKSKFTPIVTPPGVARYPHLNVPDSYQGGPPKYKVRIAVPQEEAKDFIKAYTAEYKIQYNAMLKEKRKKRLTRREPLAYSLEKDEDGNETGNVLISAATNAVIEFKNEELEIRPALFDAGGRVLDPNKVKIGGGSLLKISARMVPYYSGQFGLSLRLDAVQVLELVEFGGQRSSKDFGFGVEEEGYEFVEDNEANGGDDGPSDPIDDGKNEGDF